MEDKHEKEKAGLDPRSIHATTTAIERIERLVDKLQLP